MGAASLVRHAFSSAKDKLIYSYQLPPEIHTLTPLNESVQLYTESTSKIPLSGVSVLSLPFTQLFCLVCNFQMH